MNSANAVCYYHGDGDFCNIMVQRYKDNCDVGDLEGLETEYCPLTKVEAKLIVGWAEQVFDSKQFRFTSMGTRGWTIYLPKRVIEVKPLEHSPLTRLIEAINRHEPMADDPAVIDAINAVEDALRS